ncbi:MAG TPA: IS66 family insertion sequence element accessory protein TnpB [Opitutaceae bacterium]|jgi:transposase|nr:IS66 family insertion sequence element accessory protein TnpB [Opitutaceae bacterium]
MFKFSPETKYYARLGATDLRLSYDGFYALLKEEMKLSPIRGGVFSFTNRSKNRLKVMHWTSRGLWICPYRPEEGTLSWPKIAPDLDAAQFHALIDGLEFDHLPGWKPRKRPT